MYIGRLATIENGIEHTNIEVNDRSNRLPAQALEEKLIVSFTRLNDQKNPWLVLDIAKELRKRGELDDLKFSLYGQNVDNLSFRKQVDAAGLAHHVRLFPPTDNPAALLSKAFVYLSTSRWEGMPLSLLEAHREGACVIATKVIGNRDLIADGRNGMLYPEGDAIAAANCIVAIKNDRPLRSSLRAQAASRCKERHNRDLMVSRLQLMYRLVSDPVLRSRWARSRRPDLTVQSAQVLPSAAPAFHPAANSPEKVILNAAIHTIPAEDLEVALN